MTDYSAGITYPNPDCTLPEYWISTLYPIHYGNVVAPRSYPELVTLGQSNLQILHNLWKASARSDQNDLYFLRKRLKSAPNDDEVYSTQHLQSLIEAAEISYNRAIDYLESISSALRKAKPLPTFAAWRDPDWASHKGLEVVCFLPIGQSYLTAHGFIENPNAHNQHISNGVPVTARCEIRPGYYPDHTFEFYSTNPAIYPRADFDFFKQHQDLFRLWLKLQNIDSPALIEALHYSGNT